MAFNTRIERFEPKNKIFVVNYYEGDDTANGIRLNLPIPFNSDKTGYLTGSDLTTFINQYTPEDIKNYRSMVSGLSSDDIDSQVIHLPEDIRPVSLNLTTEQKNTILHNYGFDAVADDGLRDMGLVNEELDGRNVIVNAITNGEGGTDINIDALTTNGDASSTKVTATGSSTSRTLANRFADVINVKDYGAKGDGVTDDTSAFYAASQEGSVLFCPPGDYVLKTEPAWTGNVYLFAPSGNVNFSGTWGNANISDITNIGYRLVHSDDNTVGISIRDIYSDVGSNTSSINTEISSFGIVTNENHVNRHWGIVGSVRSQSVVQTSQIVGVYGQGWRQSSGARNTCWGGVMEARDTTVGGSVGSVVGLEVDCVSDGDSAVNQYPYNRVGLHVVGFSPTEETSTTNRLGSAIRISINNSSTRWRYGIELQHDYDFGIWCNSNAVFNESIIDLSQASFSNSASDSISVRLGQGHKISLSSADVVTLYQPLQSSIAILSVNSGAYEYRFGSNDFSCPALMINGTNTLSISGASTMANAVTLQSTPNRYFQFVVSGTTFYVPAFLPA